MPLHTIIPLCNLRYVRDTLYSAKFTYSDESINKEESKFIPIDRIIEIDKIESVSYVSNSGKNINKFKSIQIENAVQEIDKAKNVLLMDNHSVEKNFEKSKIQVLNSKSSMIDKIADKILSGSSRDIAFDSLSKPLINEEQLINNIVSSKLLKYSAPDISISCTQSLIEFNDMSIVKSFNVKLSLIDILKLDKQNYMELNCLRLKEMAFNAPFNLNSNFPISSIDKADSVYVEHDLSTIDIKTNKYYFYNIYSKDKSLNKSVIFNLSFELLKTLNKYTNTKLMYRSKNILINKINEINLLTKSINDHPLNIERDIRLFHVDSQKLMIKYQHRSHLYRISLANMFKDASKKYFYRDIIHSITKDNGKEFLYNDSLIKLFKNKEIFLNEDDIYSLYKNTDNYLGSEDLIRLYKGNAVNLSNANLIKIYQTLDKKLESLNIMSISKRIGSDKYLKDISLKNIHHGDNVKFIDITQRWWWLNSSNPSDRLIVPNKDYDQMFNLLTNDNFEYLRYDNHPIDWGSDWGKDENIPPCAVSIEIMLDLVNIIIMIWHKNVQGWFNVTGKEAIQLLMELIHDWYSMPTSSPNASYYRAYRWIRWEAEKVYFLNTKNGLQAIGILVANLIDYLKVHHFNIVPIWENPKAMDEERNFNRIAANNDLVKELDKIKGKRHYFIETQNFERKTTFRR